MLPERPAQLLAPQCYGPKISSLPCPGVEWRRGHQLRTPIRASALSGRELTSNLEEQNRQVTLGTQRAQLEQRIGFTWPRPCLFRPPLRRFTVCRTKPTISLLRPQPTDNRWTRHHGGRSTHHGCLRMLAVPSPDDANKIERPKAMESSSYVEPDLSR